MATKEEVMSGLNKVKSRLDDPTTKEKFKDFTKKCNFHSSTPPLIGLYCICSHQAVT
jgi:hypothetical protein